MSDLPATDRRVAADGGHEERTTHLRRPDAKACRTPRRQRSTVITLLAYPGGAKLKSAAAARWVRKRG
jgi:hypothetical protein